MSSLVLLALQEAMFNLLDGDATLGTMIAGVHDRVPQGSNYPYITIGDIMSQNWSSASSDGAESIITLHVYSRAGGRKETLQIMEQIHSLLHEANVSISGHSCVLSYYQRGEVDLESDGLTYHGKMVFRLLTQKV